MNAEKVLVLFLNRKKMNNLNLIGYLLMLGSLVRDDHNSDSIKDRKNTHVTILYISQKVLIESVKTYLQVSKNIKKKHATIC